MKKRNTLHNRRGYTLVELIAVVSIMAVMALVIAGLLTSASSAYMREKEQTSAKDIATVVQNEIGRLIEKSTLVYLESGALPPATNTVTYINASNIEVTETYQMTNAPASGSKHFTSSGTIGGNAVSGKLYYAANSTSEIGEYFCTSDKELSAFYGTFTIDLKFQPLFNGNNEPVGIKVICDVYNAKGKLKYDSPGKDFQLIEATGSKFGGVFSYDANNWNRMKKTEAGKGTYIDFLLTDHQADENKTYPDIYFYVS